jgi:hypothetical protein
MVGTLCHIYCQYIYWVRASSNKEKVLPYKESILPNKEGRVPSLFGSSDLEKFWMKKKNYRVSTSI